MALKPCLSRCLSHRLLSTSAADRMEAVVIGSGVIGLAIAKTLAEAGKEVLILDRASLIGSETSSRNSEVIHAGLYYPQSSSKAKLCVDGKNLLYDYCESRNIPYKRCGKLIVATHASQLENDLPSLRDRAIINGVTDVAILSKEDVLTMEPAVECLGALWSPSTGLVDSHSLMVSLLADAENHGATLALHSNVLGGYATKDGVTLQVDGMDLQCDIVVNSAGLWADAVACRLHQSDSTIAGLPAWQVPRQFFAKGNYFKLEGMKSPFNHLVYPAPDPAGGLGVHATMDFTGQSVKFGPDVQWLDADITPDEIDLTVDPRRGEVFYDAIRKYWPDLADDALVPDYSGVRPKLYHPKIGDTKNAITDFLIQGPGDHGVPGLIHLFGMESPGLTSSMAIADEVVRRIAK